MTIVHVMQGLPASGKTTFARTLDAMRFNLDDYRAMLWGDTEWSKEKEHVAVQAMIAGMTAVIKLGRDCVADNTHLTPGLPKEYRKAFAQLGVTFEVHSFADVSIEECIARDGARYGSAQSRKVGEDVIRRLATNFEKASKNGWRLTDKWMNGEPYTPPAPYMPNPSLPSIVICDIDGTVAINDGHRGHYEYESVSGDKPNPNVIRLVRELANSVEIVFMSGREDRCEYDTRRWLDAYGLGKHVELHMRATGDHRPDYIIKGELFDQHKRGRYNVVAVLDDRDQVVRLWRGMGLTCLQVADGDF